MNKKNNVILSDPVLVEREDNDVINDCDTGIKFEVIDDEKSYKIDKNILNE